MQDASEAPPRHPVEHGEAKVAGQTVYNIVHNLDGVIPRSSTEDDAQSRWAELNDRLAQIVDPDYVPVAEGLAKAARRPRESWTEGMRLLNELDSVHGEVMNEEAAWGFRAGQLFATLLEPSRAVDSSPFLDRPDRETLIRRVTQLERDARDHVERARSISGRMSALVVNLVEMPS